MALQPSTAPRRRVQLPFLTLLVAAAVVAGLAIGVNSLRSTANARAVAAAPSATAPINEELLISPVNRVSRPNPTPIVPAAACAAMDANAFAVYCAPIGAIHAAAPRASWQACAAMDATSYREYCSRGDGGRWIEGLEGNPITH
jgi:hypothetical protein